MVGETHEPIHHVFKNKLGEVEHMTNFKNLVSAQKSKFSTLLFMGTKAFMHATKKRDAFFIYAFLVIDVEPQQHEIPSQYKGYKDSNGFSPSFKGFINEWNSSQRLH